MPKKRSLVDFINSPPKMGEGLHHVHRNGSRSRQHAAPDDRAARLDSGATGSRMFACFDFASGAADPRSTRVQAYLSFCTLSNPFSNCVSSGVSPDWRPSRPMTFVQKRRTRRRRNDRWFMKRLVTPAVFPLLLPAASVAVSEIRTHREELSYNSGVLVVGVGHDAPAAYSPRTDIGGHQSLRPNRGPGSKPKVTGNLDLD